MFIFLHNKLFPIIVSRYKELDIYVFIQDDVGKQSLQKCNQPNTIEKIINFVIRAGMPTEKKEVKIIDFESEQRTCEVCNVEKSKDQFIKHGLICKTCGYGCNGETKSFSPVSSGTRHCKTCLQRKDINIFFKNKKNDCDECFVNKYSNAKKPETSQEAKDLYNIVKDLKKQHRETPTEDVELKIKEAEKNCRKQYEVDHKEIRKIGVPRYCCCGGDFKFHSIKYHFDNYMKQHIELPEELKNNNNDNK